jgi:hypothetical protein
MTKADAHGYLAAAETPLGVSASTPRAAQILSKVMRAGVQAGHLVKSPCDRVKLPRFEQVEMPFSTPPKSGR